MSLKLHLAESAVSQRLKQARVSRLSRAVFLLLLRARARARCVKNPEFNIAIDSRISAVAVHHGLA